MGAMPEAPTVSVVIPCWRSAETVSRAIASVAAQHYPALEVLAVDDASGDDTLDTLRSIAARYPAGWMTVMSRAVNGGPGPARNDGWSAARGHYIAFLDADDAWHPEKLRRQVEWMGTRPDVALTGHKSVLLREGVGTLPVADSFPARRITLPHMLLSNAFLTRTVMVRRDIPARFLGRQVSEDFLLWAEIVASGAPCYVLDVALAFSYRPEFDPGGYNGDLWGAERRELAALQRLRDAGSLSRPTWLGSSAWSLAKYVRRKLIVRRRQRREQSRAVDE